MKGIILAGGKGTRLRPMTNVVNKHILPVYDKPVIYYPVETMIRSGIRDIMVVSTPEDIGGYIQLLEEDFDVEFRYRVQKEPKGIAHALSLAEDFTDDNIAMMLGDNIILDELSDEFEDFQQDNHSAKIFLKRVNSPSRYGIANVEDGRVKQLREKPDDPQSNFAIIGLYLYDNSVFDIIDDIEPSERGEFEITDVNKKYLEQEELSYETIDSEWFDVGTPDGLLDAGNYVRKHTRDEN